MSSMDTSSSLMSAKPDYPLTNHGSKTRKPTPSLDGFQDFEHYRQFMTSPSARLYEAKLIDSSVDFRELMANAVQQDALIKQESGRQKLKKHRNEVAGRVCVPEKWGQENLLKDWMDYSLFDSLLAPKGVVSAREALVAERRRESSRCLKMPENGEQVLSFLT